MGEIMQQAGIIDANGNVSRDGLAAAFDWMTPPELPEVLPPDASPFEYMTKDELAAIILDPSTDLDTLHAIQEVAQKRLTQEKLPPQSQ